MSELFHQFGVNWQLLGAQMVNFAILLLVLKKFAYGPLLSMLHERRKRIAEGLEAAEASQKRLAEGGAQKASILADARKESLGIVQQGEQLAKERVRFMLDGGQKQAGDIVEEGKARAAEEKLKMKEDVWRESTALLTKTLGKIVEKSPETLDGALIKGVVEELKKI